MVNLTPDLLTTGKKKLILKLIFNLTLKLILTLILMLILKQLKQRNVALIMWNMKKKKQQK